MQEFLEFVARRLVQNPDDVTVLREDKDEKIVFRLQVAEQDIGKVIGRNGRTAQDLRILLAAVAAREGKRAILEIAD
ncbi:MAG TPA: KH domain-containing protein [Bacteroidota bacterium]|nr:KH domain-containing protein [Bacteroidota bacterium]